MSMTTHEDIFRPDGTVCITWTPDPGGSERTFTMARPTVARFRGFALALEAADRKLAEAVTEEINKLGENPTKNQLMAAQSGAVARVTYIDGAYLNAVHALFVENGYVGPADSLPANLSTSEFSSRLFQHAVEIPKAPRGDLGPN